MRTAVVHDWLNGMRGGEKVLEAILPLVPEPDHLHSLPRPAAPSRRDIERHPDPGVVSEPTAVRPDALPPLPPLFSRAIESFDLSGYDLVVSSSHCVAKGAIAPPGVPHLCYCHTPVRYAYEQFDLYFPRGKTRFYGLKSAVIARLRAWDVATASRPTQYLANSTAVANRVRRRYGREAGVCHPPVDVDFFHPSETPAPAGTFFSGSGPSCRTRDTTWRSRRPGASAGGSCWSAAARRRRASAVSRRLP